MYCFIFLSDINANEAIENPQMLGAIQEEITREQKLDLEPVSYSVPQSESAGNTTCTLDNFKTLFLD